MKNKLNIYIEFKDKKKIDDLKIKYQLSLTTIVDVLIKWTLKTFTENGEETKTNDLTQKYLYKKGKKTSITQPYIMNLKVNANKYALATNSLKIYLEHDIKKYIQKEHLVNRYYNEINKELNQRTDNWWNYNQHVRYLKRFLKENPKERTQNARDN